MTLFQIIDSHVNNNYVFSIGLLGSNVGYEHIIGRFKGQWTPKDYINVLKEL